MIVPRIVSGTTGTSTHGDERPEAVPEQPEAGIQHLADRQRA